VKIVELSRFNNSWYRPASGVKIAIWYLFSVLFFKTMLPFPSKIKVAILRLFGAKVGKNIVIKPNVSIKYPWLFKVGDNCWIGEGVWIDNLAQVTLGDNVCLSQDSYLLTGSHNYKSNSFDLMLGEITLEDGVWIGAKATVCPDVTCRSHSILTVGSVATQEMQEYSIYQGNPATFKRKRELS
jgi:putative colanic acid biosynthesis acetyltransferase WcaF